MNDLKEIGGFIVSADPYVNHDTSLSGNGTLTSPLGVVPSSVYNETLIYQKPDNSYGSSACALSEPISAFNNIKIEYRYGQLHEYSAFTGNKNFVDNINTDYPNAPQECFFQLNFTGSNIYVNHGYQIQRSNFGSSPTTATSVVNIESEYSRQLITRIWGINRKQ